jgi:hypothetical protein
MISSSLCSKMWQKSGFRPPDSILNFNFNLHEMFHFVTNSHLLHKCKKHINLPSQILQGTKYLTFMGLCIVNVLLNATNKMQHNIYSLLLSTLYMFRAVSPPIIRSSKLYTQHRVFVTLICSCC